MPSGFWPHRYVAGLPAEVDEAEFLSALSEAGVDGVLGASNAPVSYMAFPETAETTVANLDVILPPGDPRRDPFLVGAGKLFRSGSGDLNLVYLPKNHSVRFYENLFSRIPGGAVLLDQRRVPSAAAALMMLIPALAAGAAVRSRRLSAVLCSLPWALLLLFWDGLPPSTAFLGFLASSGRIWSERSWASFWRLPASLASLAGALGILLSASGIPSLGFLMFCTAALGSWGLFVLLPPPVSEGRAPAPDSRAGSGGLGGILRNSGRRFGSVLRRRSDHHLFEPLSLFEMPGKSRTFLPAGDVLRRAAMPVAALAVILLLPAVTGGRGFFGLVERGGGAGEPGPAVPAPVLIEAGAGSDGGADFGTVDGLRTLFASHDADSLPDLSDLVASAAYQEGFLYGSEFRIPLPGDELTLQSFTNPASRLAVENKTMKIYDEAWFSTTVFRVSQNGLGKLLTVPGGFASVQLQTRPSLDSGVVFDSLHYAVMAAALSAALLLWIFPAAASSGHKRSFSPGFVLRRRAQAA